MIFGAACSLLLLATKVAASGSYYDVSVPAGTIALPIDHFNDKDTRQFLNRYWYNDTYYKSGGPVFFLDNGESGVEPSAVNTNLQPSTNESVVMELARRHNGVAILWEHRYFGESHPFPYNRTTGLPHGGIPDLKYHTIDQALKDAVVFASKFQLQKRSGSDLNPSKTPWVWIGGSYPGSRAAWVRQAYPETFYAAWASSSPVNPLFDGSPFMEVYGAALPKNCTADIDAAMRRVDQILGGSDRLALDMLGWNVMNVSYTAQNLSFIYSSSTDFVNYDVASELSRPLSNHYQYWTPKNTSQVFCDYLESYVPAKNHNASATDFSLTKLAQSPVGKVSEKGIAAEYGPDYALSAYLFATLKQTPEMAAIARRKAVGSTAPPAVYSNTLSWDWMVLNEFGVFQGVSDQYFERNKGKALFSKYHTPEMVRSKSYIGQFPKNAGYADIVFPHEPSVDALNKKYGGFGAIPSNVMFTSGEFDPWRAFTHFGQQTAVGAPNLKGTTKIPKCNTVPDNKEVFGGILPGVGHCADQGPQDKNMLPTADQPYDYWLPLFSSALKEWLQCFDAGDAKKASTTGGDAAGDKPNAGDQKKPDSTTASTAAASAASTAKPDAGKDADKKQGGLGLGPLNTSELTAIAKWLSQWQR